MAVLTVGRATIRALATTFLANFGVLAMLLVPVELIFGTWVRGLGLSDLRRFSIPIGVRYTFDTSKLYAVAAPITYSRDDYGLRGRHTSLESIDVLTVGGSTTDQRYLDDRATWQAIAEDELRRAGKPLTIANAGVDGQSTIGHVFNFDFWFPLLPGLQPRAVLFYIGANDVLGRADRSSFDGGMDARSWRFRSALFQLYRTVRGNIRARAVGVVHGRMMSVNESDFTSVGLLPAAERDDLAAEMTGRVLANVDVLAARSVALGAVPIVMTQTGFAWNADNRPPRGLDETLVIYGRTVNFADVAAVHQALNRGLLAHCQARRLTCLDLANDVAFEASDYYDFLHNTPSGARKIGQYVAGRLSAVDLPSRDRR